ncbi:MAG: GNAT family N-acetyltransferase [Alteromonadaceae bacterium]|nr:GNAT family N-acetyltransferase [Alteromonadaceae bacterium]
MIKIRNFQKGDEIQIINLFLRTIRTVNIRDYSQEQVNAWAPDEYDQEKWFKKIALNDPLVATIDNKIVGYADVQGDGYIDHFFCHADFQGKGIGKLLMETLQNAGIKNGCTRFYSHVSITAKPFFQYSGFKIVKEQWVEIRGQKLKNFVMEKVL